MRRWRFRAYRSLTECPVFVFVIFGIESNSISFTVFLRFEVLGQEERVCALVVVFARGSSRWFNLFVQLLEQSATLHEVPAARFHGSLIACRQERFRCLAVLASTHERVSLVKPFGICFPLLHDLVDDLVNGRLPEYDDWLAYV